MTKQDARAAVRQMRQFSERPGLHDAVAAGDISRSWADAIARWTRKLPGGMRDETDKILLEAAAAGASLEDLATIAAAAIEQWRSQQPDPEDDFDFRDRYRRLGPTFGGAGVIRGDLTPECAAALTAVLEALGKKRGPEDDRNEGQRFHDALRRGLPPAAPRPDGPRPGRRGHAGDRARPDLPAPPDCPARPSSRTPGSEPGSASPPTRVPPTSPARTPRSPPATR